MMRNLLLLLFPLSAWANYDWTCNLYCYNEGKCQHGKGKFGSYAGLEEDQVEALPWEKAQPDVGMFCSCPVGFTGLQCEIAMKTCGNDEHTCFNGAACTKERSGGGTFWWRCECDVEASVMDADYAGKYCEHVATVFCNHAGSDTGYAQTSYCTNGGKCKARDHAGQKHFGCTCLDGFEGSHCEINDHVKSLSFSDITVAATSKAGAGVIAVIIFASVFCVTGCLYFLDKKDKKRRKRRRRGNAGIQANFSHNPNSEVI